ncbi:MAG: hypothetical protein ACON5K_00180, partial [Bacteroidia bacterium]
MGPQNNSVTYLKLASYVLFNWRGVHIRYDKGTAYGDLDSFTTAPLGFGYPMSGGTVAYIFTESDRGYHEDSISGIIVLDSIMFDNDKTYTWGCQGNEEVGNTSEEIGAGASNTKTFI